MKLTEDQERWVEDAARAIQAYRETNIDNPAEVEETVIDLITNLMHLARYKKRNVQQIITMCQNHFEVETHPELEY